KYCEPALRPPISQADAPVLGLSLCREGRLTLCAAEPDQAARRLPEPGVLQAAEHASLHRRDAAGDLLRRGPGRVRGPSKGTEALLREHGIALDVEDERVSGEALEFSFRGELTRVQHPAARALLADEDGVFVAPPGVGKTVVGAYLTAQRGCSTLVLVHRRPLLDRWRTQLSLFLGIEPKAIGQVGGGKRSANGRLDVAMIQSLVRAGKVADLGCGLWSGDRGRVPPCASRLVRAGARGGQGPLRGGLDGDATASGRPAPHHRDATRAGPLRGGCQARGRPPSIRAASHRARDRVPRARPLENAEHSGPLCRTRR